MLNRAGWLRGSSVRVLGVAGVVFLGACGRHGEAAEEAAPTVVRLGPGDVTVATLQEIQSGPVVSGTLKAENEAQVRSQAAGTVIQVYAEQGQAVRAGQLLARIEADAAQQQLLSAQQGVRSAQQNYEMARRQAERTATLLQAGAVSEQQAEAARNAAAAAQSQLAGARAQVAAAGKQVENAQVRAPISGVVSQRPVNAGDVVSPGTALFTIVNPSGMKLEASVPSDQLGAVHVGAPVAFTVSGYPGRTFTGRVDRISPAADPTTRQVPIFVTLPNSEGRLVSGLFAQGRVASQSQQTLVVPATAVDQTGAFPTVLKVTGGQVRQVQVQLGAHDAEHNRVAVTSGLSAGDTVLISTSQGVPAGTPVQVTGAVAQQ